MSASLTLRARLPDGRGVVLPNLPASTTHQQLLDEIQTRCHMSMPPARVLVAGPPPKPMNEGGECEISSFLRNGDGLIVEPAPVDLHPAHSEKKRKKKTSKATRLGSRSNAAKNSAPVRANVAAPSAAASNIAGINSPHGGTPSRREVPSSSGKRTRSNSHVHNIRQVKSPPPSRPVDDDDPNDITWVASDEDAIQPAKPKKRRQTKRAGAFRGAGHTLGAASASTPAANAEPVEVDQLPATHAAAAASTVAAGGAVPAVRDAEEGLGVALLQSVTGAPDSLDVCGRKFRDSLRSALEERQAEATGEKRYEAWLARRYSITPYASGRLFRVQYRSLHERGWTRECDGGGIVAYDRTVLQGAFREVLAAVGLDDDRENLRASAMAKCSPRIFWNMVRLFPDNVEDGLRGLVPEGDRSFLDQRRRFLSEKAKRNEANAANEREMNLVSD